MGSLKNQKPIVMLQSGGRDSAVACVRLLKEGIDVQAITFLSSSNNELISIPRKRAEELSGLFPDYSWAAVDYSIWANNMKNKISQELDQKMPRSCLICAVARVTAAMAICKSLGSNLIATGYVNYQASWAEQTPVAVALQKRYLEKKGYSLLTPAQDISSKEEVVQQLINNNLTSTSLENPCCVALEGTQPVDSSLTKKALSICFAFADSNTPCLNVLDIVGKRSLCL